MKCHETDQIINGYLDDSTEKQTELQKHIEECPVCRKKYESFLQLQKEMKAINNEEKTKYQNTKKEDRLFYNEMWQKIHQEQNKKQYGFLWIEVVVLCTLILVSIRFPYLPITEYGFGVGVLALSIGGTYLQVEKRKHYEHME